MTNINTDLVESLKPFFLGRNEKVTAWLAANVLLTAFANVRGAWHMAVTDVSAGVIDQSGHGHNLTYNGAGGTNFGFHGLTVYAALDGSTKYLSIASNSQLNFNSRITVMSWARFNAGGNTEYIMAKSTAWPSAGSQWRLMKGSADNFRFGIVNGTTAYENPATLPCPVGEWIFAAGQFQASTHVKGWLGTKSDGLQSNENITSIPATFNSAASTDLTIGGNATGGSLLDGDVTYSVIMDTVLPERFIQLYFELTQAAFF